MNFATEKGTNGTVSWCPCRCPGPGQSYITFPAYISLLSPASSSRHVLVRQKECEVANIDAGGPTGDVAGNHFTSATFLVSCLTIAKILSAASG